MKINTPNASVNGSPTNQLKLGIIENENELGREKRNKNTQNISFIYILIHGLANQMSAHSKSHRSIEYRVDIVRDREREMKMW